MGIYVCYALILYWVLLRDELSSTGYRELTVFRPLIGENWVHASGLMSLWCIDYLLSIVQSWIYSLLYGVNCIPFTVGVRKQKSTFLWQALIAISKMLELTGACVSSKAAVQTSYYLCYSKIAWQVLTSVYLAAILHVYRQGASWTIRVLGGSYKLSCWDRGSGKCNFCPKISRKW